MTNCLEQNHDYKNGEWVLKSKKGEYDFITKNKILHKSDHTSGDLKFFSPCSRFVGFETKKDYAIFRVLDGTAVCVLKKSNVRIVMGNKGKGGCYMVSGLIDIKGRAFYIWNLQTLVHLSSGYIHLFR